MSVDFSWSYFWSYYQRIGYESVRQAMKEEILPWIFHQTTKAQIEVLKDAPKEFIESIKAQLKPDTLRSLAPETTLIDWSKV